MSSPVSLQQNAAWQAGVIPTDATVRLHASPQEGWVGGWVGTGVTTRGATSPIGKSLTDWGLSTAGNQSSSWLGNVRGRPSSMEELEQIRPYINLQYHPNWVNDNYDSNAFFFLFPRTSRGSCDHPDCILECLCALWDHQAWVWCDII